jgi:hypothetical protein
MLVEWISGTFLNKYTLLKILNLSPSVVSTGGLAFISSKYAVNI